MLNAIQALPQAQQDNIVGGAFYGYTKNQQNNGMLPGFPQQNLKVFCRPDDGVCGGQLLVTAGHLAYSGDGTVKQGAQFLAQKATSATAKN